MKISVFQIEKLNNSLFYRLLSYLSSERQHRILQYRHEDDRLRSLFGSLVTTMQLSTQLQCEETDFSYQVTKYGKEELIGHDIYYNRSHAGQYVISAISDVQVGVDIEHKQYRDFSLFQHIWTESEKKRFKVDSLEEFYYLWTAKESYVKWLGTGLATELSTVSIDLNGSIYHHGNQVDATIQNLTIDPQYTCAVCSRYRIQEVEFLTTERLISFFTNRIVTK